MREVPPLITLHALKISCRCKTGTDRRERENGRKSPRKKLQNLTHNLPDNASANKQRSNSPSHFHPNRAEFTLFIFLVESPGTARTRRWGSSRVFLNSWCIFSYFILFFISTSLRFLVTRLLRSFPFTVAPDTHGFKRNWFGV